MLRSLPLARIAYAAATVASLPRAAKTHVIIIKLRMDFLVELGRRISSQAGDVRESSYLLQRIFVMIQRFNSVLLHDSLTVDIPDL